MILGSYIMTRGECTFYSIIVVISLIVISITIYYIIKCYLTTQYKRDHQLLVACIIWFAFFLLLGTIFSFNIYYGIQTNTAIMNYFKIPSSLYYNLSSMTMNDLQYIMESRLKDAL